MPFALTSGGSSTAVLYLSLIFHFLDSNSSPVPHTDNCVPLAFSLASWHPKLFGLLLDLCVARDYKFVYHLSLHFLYTFYIPFKKKQKVVFILLKIIHNI